MRGARHRVGLSVVALAMLLTTGCQVSQLQFVADRRLTFEQPAARSRVTVPVTVGWSMKRFTPSGLDGGTSREAGVFAVFVDRAPMPAGKDIRWIARNDKTCSR